MSITAYLYIYVCCLDDDKALSDHQALADNDNELLVSKSPPE